MKRSVGSPKVCSQPPEIVPLRVHFACIQGRIVNRSTWCAGAAFIRTKGEAGTGDVVEAVRHVRNVMGDIRKLQTMDEDELYNFAKVRMLPSSLFPSMRSGLGADVVVASGGGRRLEHP